MDGVDHDHHRRIRRTLKERLGLKGMGCCGGPTWGFRPTSTPINASDSEDDLEEQQLQPQNHHHQLQLHLQLQLQEDQQEQISNQVSDPGCFSPAPVLNSSGNSMNLAAALAAERHFRAVEGTNNLEASPTNVDLINNNNNNSNTSSGGGDGDGGGGGGGGGGNNVGVMITAPGTPMRVSLMRLLAETDGGDVEEERRAVGGGGGRGNDTVCCVCMVRKKGAAFIPCGHTFCRVCSREVWLNRGSCPLCNRSILEILDIF
ncbi:hypothetical protein Dsin_028075 [Dipteronia sinensis]|uniref:RING-type domain-containing protein n=1 Tax=Dipteronia sinensis TaxID=43782 RepID=A0AAE0DU84_9ROSI|nr:hypothetical protein Dsin_028075 [Dipteronia sinensis]